MTPHRSESARPRAEDAVAAGGGSSGPGCRASDAAAGPAGHPEEPRDRKGSLPEFKVVLQRLAARLPALPGSSGLSLPLLSLGLFLAFQSPIAPGGGPTMARAAGTEATAVASPGVNAADEVDAAGVERILQLADSAYLGLRTYEADFEQNSETHSVQLQRQSSGKVYFEKPDKMRWSYREPEVREVYLLADRMLVYLPARNTVMKQTLGDALPGVAPAQLFLGVNELRQSFSISLAPPDREEKGAVCLRLVPRQRSGLAAEEIFLWLGEKDFLPVKSESRDILGNITTLRFRHARTNARLQDDLFRFQIPADAEVVEEMY